jgi:hypothetical protein
MKKMLAALAIFALLAVAQVLPNLRSVHTVYIGKLPNDLDQYIRAEISKQMRGSMVVVLDEKDADGVITGVSEEEKGTGAKITGRYLGLRDIATASLSLVDKNRKVILWSDEAGDRSLLFGVMRRGGERKVAERLVKKLRKAMGESTFCRAFALRATSLTGSIIGNESLNLVFHEQNQELRILVTRT